MLEFALFHHLSRYFFLYITTDLIIFQNIYDIYL